MSNKNIDKKSKTFNNTFCCFNEKGNSIKETLALSFIDYLTFKENEKSLAKKGKES